MGVPKPLNPEPLEHGLQKLFNVGPASDLSLLNPLRLDEVRVQGVSEGLFFGEKKLPMASSNNQEQQIVLKR